MQLKQLSKLECARIRIIKNQQSAYFELLEKNWDNLNMILKFIYSAAFRHLAPLVMFTDRLYSKDYQDILSASILPFIREKLPNNHCFFMDKDPKHTCRSTQRFIILNDINHCMTPPQSPDLMSIEMVYKY